MQTKVLGNFEKVDFPEFGIVKISAKIDSGAFHGAIHCTKVTEEETENGIVLHFSPFDHPEVKITTSKYWVDEVKSSNGIAEDRYFVNTLIYVDGETYPISLSLADRSTMRWPVIIGSRFLKKHHFLVDVNKRTGVKLRGQRKKV